MSKGLSPTKKAAQANFAALCDAGKSPEEIVLIVMTGGKDAEKVTDRQYQAAKDLLRYRLPALQSVEATVARTELTHEQWIDQMDKEIEGE